MPIAAQRPQRLTAAKAALVRATRRLDVVRRRAKHSVERGELAARGMAAADDDGCVEAAADVAAAREQAEAVQAEMTRCLSDVDGALTTIDELIAEVRAPAE